MEDGDMLLADGRRILRKDRITGEEVDPILPIHEDFKMWVLANRPGFPFLGNDFFGAMGKMLLSI